MPATTLSLTENAILTNELARLEKALTTLNTGAVADCLLTHFPDLHAIDATDTSDHEGARSAPVSAPTIAWRMAGASATQNPAPTSARTSVGRQRARGRI